MPTSTSYPLLLIPLMPLLGAFVLGTIGNRLRRADIHLIGCGSVLAALAGVGLAIPQIAAGSTLSQSFEWFRVGGIDVSWGFSADRLTATLLLVVTGVGLLIHVYSAGYMARDPAPARYFAYLNLFVAAMLLLVLADNLVVLFVGWEGVGLCSYLLIGFWYQQPDNASAGRKAFVVNRVGDFGYSVATFAVIALFGSVSFQNLGQLASSLNPAQVLSAGVFAGWHVGAVITLICLLYLLAAAGKSAQIPLYVWLPDAMAGPTPVSALIHAATMVTAGIYLMCRLSFLYAYSGTALVVVGSVGAATALLAAVIATAQNDIKKVLAYSTISQLGFMVLAVGVGAFWAAVLHLVCHAFFKALLFLAAGNVIHGTGEEQDLRKMGGLAQRLPDTTAAFLIGTAAITGLLPLAGFFSKDAVLAAAWTTSNAVAPWTQPLFFAVGSLAALGTAFYMCRLALLAFFGAPRSQGASEAHEADFSMTLVTWILAALSIGALWLGLPLRDGPPMEQWLRPVFAPAMLHLATLRPVVSPSVPWGSFALALAIAWIGAVLAFGWWRNPSSRSADDRTLSGPRGLLANQFYVDAVYRTVVTQPTVWLARFLSRVVDRGLIDGVGVRGPGAVLQTFSRYALRPLQNGNLQSYATAMALGAVALLWLVLRSHR